MTLRIATLLLSSGLPILAQMPRTAPTTSLPMCSSSDLSLAVDGENGNFDGMSHSGTLVVLRNLGPKPCRVPKMPLITFLDSAGKPLMINRTIPAGMHPGPVMVPVAVAGGAELTTPLRWVSSPVYSPGVCFKPAKLSVQIDGKQITTAFGNQICGPDANHVTFEQPPVAPDPPSPGFTPGPAPATPSR